MTKQDALEKLELEGGASQQAIKQQYQEFYNEFQMRITNAPTTHQKSLYQKKLKELEDAFVLLTGSNTEDTDAELPGMAPIEGIPTISSTPNKLSKAEASKLLGLKEHYSKGKLEDAYRLKKRDCEQGIKNAINEDVANVFERTLYKIEKAYQILIPLAQTTIIKEPIPKETKKGVSPIIWVVLAVVIVGAGLFIWQPWEDKMDPAIKEQFTKLKVEADLLATQKNWNDALEKYEEANNLMFQTEVQDSIASITKRLKGLANAEETKAWESAKSSNTIDAYNEYLTAYSEGKFKAEVNRMIAAIKSAWNSSEAVKKRAAQQLADKKKQEEAARQQLAAQQKQQAAAIKQADDENIEVPFAVIEKVPVYPGCEGGTSTDIKACMSRNISNFVAANFNTNLASKLGLSGRQRINVMFKIDKNGNIINVAARAPHPELEKEAKRVIGLLPKMKPGTQRGKHVTVPYSMPIVFNVEE
jgi:hypothetical protein